jgi:hypothetical protein
VYNHITRLDNGKAYKEIWKAKILEKVKKIMWLVAQKSILTKENMIKRNWGWVTLDVISAICQTVDHWLFGGIIAFCFHQRGMSSSFEQFDSWVKNALPRGEKFYMLGLTAVCWAIWNARNNTCFEKKHIKSPNEILFSACMFMNYWTGGISISHRGWR